MSDNKFLDYAGLSTFWNNVKTVIEENEEITAAALVDLNNKIDDNNQSISLFEDQINNISIDLTAKADKTELATVAKTGSYNDLTNKPGITFLSGNVINSLKQNATCLTANPYELAVGTYNISNKVNTKWGNIGNTLFSVGIGTANTARANAVEIMQDGSLFINGIGGYIGEYNIGALPIQTVLSQIESTADTAFDYALDAKTSVEELAADNETATSAEILAIFETGGSNNSF